MATQQNDQRVVLRAQKDHQQLTLHGFEAPQIEALTILIASVLLYRNQQVTITTLTENF